MSFFFNNKATAAKQEASSINQNTIHSNQSFIQPDDDDLISHFEIEQQREKWKIFIKSRGNIWSEKWLWQNWSHHRDINSVIARKFMKVFNHKVKTRRKLKHLIRSGVPPELRGNCNFTSNSIYK
jgi:hypothetical protein